LKAAPGAVVPSNAPVTTLLLSADCSMDAEVNLILLLLLPCTSPCKVAVRPACVMQQQQKMDISCEVQRSEDM
jgi:hypothetical protein